MEALRHGDGLVSGRRLARALGISRTAVWKHVSALRRSGYGIESVRAKGYRLVDVPETLSSETIDAHRSSKRLGGRIITLDSTTSTNDVVADLARSGAAEGTTVTAELQTAGRGRMGRSWISPAHSNLMMSVLLRPAVPPAIAPRLSLLVALAVMDVVRDEGVDARIKWPNDVVVNDRKLCGILTEIEAEADRVRFVVVGIGLNVNVRASDFPSELRQRATSLRAETGRLVERARVAGRLLSSLERYYQGFLDGDFPALAERWNRYSAMTGRTVQVEGPVRSLRGRCEGIDTDGALLLRTGASVERVIAGDVTVVEGGYER